MPLNKEIKKVMVIGSGPIVIGQAAEFDYAGTQACRALKEDGLEVVLVNSNPATIMTDNVMADKIYIEPLTLPTIKRIIEKERPDSLLSTLGGQTGLTLSMQLAKEGFLDMMGVKLLGANPETIDKAEDRQIFKDTMLKIGQPVIPSLVVNNLEAALDFANSNGYPLIIRPAFTLGGSGGGIASNEEEFIEITRNGLRLSPIHQVLVEKCISGWKEIEFEVMRDSAGNVITICSMENLDPVGVHTGDSIVIAPAVTLSDKEYQMLRSAALSIIEELKIEGGCNCQFALNPESFEYAVIEVNPRVSRSSALASKATGYPIAKVAAKIAIGYTLPEILNAVTKKTYACFEPTIDYVVVKFPKWPFDKFVYAKRTLGTQMKATGEVMAIGTTFEQAMMKAVRGVEIGMTSLTHAKYRELSDETINERLYSVDDERIFIIYEALRRGITVDKIHEITMIDEWFLHKLVNLISMEERLRTEELDSELYLQAKKLGYTDSVIEEFMGKKLPEGMHRRAVYKMVDTCAAEFSAETPYFYSTYDDENEAEEFISAQKGDKKTIIVFGSGPIRIGQGIEFDYSSVHCVWSLKKAGYDVVIVNNNPETVSTDFDTADRLYFEPLTSEDVMNIIETEKPYGVVVAFGGQTAIKLTKFLAQNNINILGTSADSIDAAEDRERFDELLEKNNIKRPIGFTVMTTDEALEVANKIGYPVLMRPSYVLGGQNMIIAFTDDDIKEYMEIILSHNIENPVLIDKYLMGIEIEVDAICDGEDILIAGIMEHVERTGIHSGDSIAVYPSWNINDKLRQDIVECTRKLSTSLKILGLVNIQYLIYKNQLYVIEVNPRSSRTIPYISKVTGVPMVDLATRAMLGEKLKDMGYGTGLYKTSPYVAVKVPVFSFEKLMNVDNHLGPEMKSTGEVLGLASTREEALYKGLVAAGYTLKKKGGVFITVRDSDKSEIGDTAKRYYDLGFELYATRGTAKVIEDYGMKVSVVDKIYEGENNTLKLIESGKIDYVISTSAKGRIPTRDSVKIRRKTVERAIPCLTSIDTANAVADCLKSRYSQVCTELVDINNMRKEKATLEFTKMEACGNDYIYFNCFNQKIDNPEGLSIRLADRHFGIGGDGVVLMYPSNIADVKMRMFNLDGTEGRMCGNAARCIAKYMIDNKLVSGDTVTIETLSGIREVSVEKVNGEVSRATVNMGKAILNPALIPVKLPGENAIGVEAFVAGKNYKITCVSMGNPHCVVFSDQFETPLDSLDLSEIGPKFEYDPLFPERVNTEFIKVLNRTTLKMRVWERGSGETWACGSGACAAVVAAVENGYCPKNEDITVKLRGGDLQIRYTDDAVFLSGDAIKVYEGRTIL
jgi:carbamoyl-phosphate synthase large subunit